MPHLSAASRLAFPLHSVATRWFPIACAEPPPPGEALRAAESQDGLSLPAPEVKAETTTVNVGTLRVVLPIVENKQQGEESITQEDSEVQKSNQDDAEPQPPVRSAEC
jgi:hypothetical protein